MAALLQVVLAMRLLAPAVGFRRVQLGVVPLEAVGKDADKAVGRDADRVFTPTVAPLPAALRNGVVFVRPQKTGSSVFSGIVFRLAERHGLAHARGDFVWFRDPSLGKLDTPAVIAGPHLRRIAIAPSTDRLMPGAAFATMVRDPTARCLSLFYFENVTRLGVQPTSDNLIRHMNTCPPDFLFAMTMPATDSSVKALLANYSLVGVMERFDESALLLSKKLGVGLNDILYVRQHVSGSSVSPETGRTLGRHPPISKEPAVVQQFAKRHFGGGLDEQLHEAANAAIDEGIAGYGLGFQADLAEYRRRLRAVADKCDPWLAKAFADSNPSDAACFPTDVGCAQPCIDSVIGERNWD